MTRRRSTAGTARATPPAGDKKSGPSIWWARAFAAFLALFGLIPLSNLVIDQTPDPWYNAAAAHWAILTCIVLILAYLVAGSLGERLDRWYSAVESRILAIAPRTFALSCALVSFGLAAATALFAFRRHWVSVDEALAMWHGRMLLAGRLWVPADPDPVFFSNAVTGTGDRWFSAYPIGGPVLMALGDLTHARWLIGPVFTGIAVYAFYRFAARTMDERTARGATLLLAVCGNLMLMGGTSMTHTESLALIMIALAAAAAWATSTTRAEAYVSAAVIGLSIALTVSLRPYDAVLAALVIGAFQLTAVHGSRWRVKSFAIQLLAGVAPVALVLAANASMTGHPFTFGYEALNGSGHDPGFHISPHGYEHTPLRGVILASSYLLLLNRSLLYTPIPALLLAVAGLVVIRRVTRWDLLTYAMILMFVAGYGAYWFDGTMFGPRFLYPVVPLFVLLVARAPGLLRERLHGSAARATLLVIPLCLAYAFLIPGARFSLLGIILQERTGREFFERDASRLLREGNVHHALAFVPTGWQNRQFARMTAFHLELSDAQQISEFADACRLQHALDYEDRHPALPTDRERRIVAATQAIVEAPVRKGPGGIGQARLLSLDSLAPDCVAEMRADSVTTMLYEQFLPLITYDGAGRMTGDVIFARDMGPLRNEQLRARFADRSWYRTRYAGESMTTVLVPYPAPQADSGVAARP